MKDRTQKLRKVTRLPKCLLRLMGKLDAKKGIGVVDAHIAHWIDKLGAFENDLVKAEEKAVFPVREKAALAVSALERAKAALSVPAIPTNTDKPKPTDPKLIRAVRNAKAKAVERRNNAESLHKASTEELIGCNELIISSNVKTRERIEAMRNTAKASIDAYVAGVRKIFPDYSPQVKFSDALEIYLSPHSVLDAKVKEVAYAYNTKEVC